MTCWKAGDGPLIEETSALPSAPPTPPVEAGPRAGLDRWRYGRVLLTLGGALALLAFYAPWQRATYFDSGAPGNQQVRDIVFATIFTRMLRPGAALFGVYTNGSLLASVTRDLVNTIPPLLGLLLALLLWLPLGRQLRVVVVTVSTFVLLCAGVVAVEYCRLILAVRSGDSRAMGDATHIGSVVILRGGVYAYRTTTFAWGYFLLVGALLVWAAGLALVFLALRRTRRQSGGGDGSAAAGVGIRRDRRVVASLLALGVAAWTLGANYLPWMSYNCPSGIVNNIHYFCVSGSATGNVVYTLIAQLPTQSQSYQQIVSARLISPSILNIASDIIFGSLVPFTFIAVSGLGAAVCALLTRLRRPWGYWAYLAFVALVTAILCARTRTVYDESTTGTISLGAGIFVTFAGALLMGVAVVLLQRSAMPSTTSVMTAQQRPPS